jgi:hypothetical protein
MNNYIINIQQLLYNYESEISQLKKIIVQLRTKSSDKEVISKYAIPAFYSMWEGFFVKSLVEFINYINSLSLNMSDLKGELLAHNLDANVNLQLERKGFSSIKNYSESIHKYFKEPFSVKISILTDSNVNYKNANNMLGRLCLDKLPIEREKQLNKLLLFRNNIAHGECSVPFNDDVIDEISEIVVNCMYDIFLILENGVMTNSFKV